MILSITARFFSDKQYVITCSCSYDGWTYVGARNGLVYRTMDGISYEEFWNVGSPCVSSIHSFGGALFIGTSPDGRILMHNFNTGNRYEYVHTGDYSISSIVDDGTLMYASTSPSGMVLSFNGSLWSKIYESFTDISSMCIYNGNLYAFSENEGVVRVRSNGKWSFMMNDGKIFVVGKKSLISTSLNLIGNPREEVGIRFSSVVGSKMFFSGSRNPVLYSYDGSKVSVVHSFNGDRIETMDSSLDQLFLSVGNGLYLYQLDTGLEIDIFAKEESSSTQTPVAEVSDDTSP